MSSKVKLKEAFDVDSKHGAFYTGGNIEWHQDILFCQTTSAVSLFNIENGVVTATVGEDNGEDADTIQTFTASSERIVTSHKSGLLKLWTRGGALQKVWKYIHKGPIARLVLNGEKLASGGSDGVIRLWDLQYQVCVLGLKECVGVINLVEFHPNKNILFGSGDDGKINAWDLDNKGQLYKTYNGHFSKVTSVAFHSDNKHFVSSSRDKVLILWNIEQNVAIRTVPVYEAIESVICLPNKFELPSLKISGKDEIFVASAGENAIIRIWDVTKSKEIYAQNNSFVSKSKEEGGLAIIKLLYNKDTNTLAVVSVDHNIILHDLKTFNCIKQFVGFSDEVLDLTHMGKNDSHVAVATNSQDIKLYENSTMNCQLLKGHTDIVLALKVSNANPNLLLSSAKDNTIRLWSLSLDGSVACVGIGMRHTGSVDTISFCNLTTNFAVSGSQDTCVKVWQIPQKLELNASLYCTHTEIAHQKGINCVVVSPNDKIIATASQDKTAKLWTDSLQLLGVLRGHRRGIWCIRFSPVDQVVLTSSTDCTIKLWSVTELNCLKTIEGHEASVHRAEFISNGLQILSAGADGLIKLFNLKTAECVQTLDQHEQRVWALAVKSDETGFITGGADSMLIKWKDVTEDRQMERTKKNEELVLQEQQLSNYIQNNQLLKALKLALRLERPLQVLRIVQNIIKQGESGLPETISILRNDQKEALLKCAIEWNTNSRNCQPAQLVLSILINELQGGDFRPVGLSSVLEGTLPYTERHFKRLTQLLQDLHFVKYTINCMQPHAKHSNV
ncbi:hypothetical protein ILUMI_05253 [Ignelater luminosus]|uniref:U3 small nucleolar RNA-associated protein 13 C-terminal domain-containing protein n=1 Tax=Ignelater luminosus TaxID=2038154 RepID=A0A8K0GDR3_IGNLU|nr:hypothetical protein ILUMI_05253 [Ignelater luminosus]